MSSLPQGSGLSPANSSGASHARGAVSLGPPGFAALLPGASPHPARSMGEGREGHQFPDPLSLCGTWSAGTACLLFPHDLRQEGEDNVAEG